jgi:hypothetical protein
MVIHGYAGYRGLRVQSDETGVVYPQLRKHKCKDGKNSYASHSLQEISETKICEAITKAEICDKVSVEKLGMADLLLKHKKWDTIPTFVSDSDTQESDEANDEDQTDENIDSDIISVVQEVCTEESEADIEKFSDGLVTKGRLINIHLYVRQRTTSKGIQGRRTQKD